MKYLVYSFFCVLLFACNTHHKGFNDKGVLVADTLMLNDSLFEIKSYDDNGKLIEEASLLNGLLNGVQKMYFPSGALKSEIAFENGKENGNWKIWYANGFVHLKGKSENGKYVKVEEYYDNGTLAYQLNFEPAGVKNGEVKYFNTHGELIQKGYYFNNAKNGLWLSYNQNQIYKEVAYELDTVTKINLLFDRECVLQTADKVVLTTQRTNINYIKNTAFVQTNFMLDSLGDVIYQLDSFSLSNYAKSFLAKKIFVIDGEEIIVYKLIKNNKNYFYTTNFGVFVCINGDDNSLFWCDKINVIPLNNRYQKLFGALKNDKDYFTFQ